MMPDFSFKFEANLTQLANSIPKGCYNLLTLGWGKRFAENKHYMMLLEAQNQKERAFMLSDQADLVDGKLVQKTIDGNMATQFLMNEQNQEIENVAGNMAVAFEELKNTPDEEISNREVDPDFFARWRREAKVIGAKELQFIWGKILSEEVKRPESISYRTLDVVKNLTCFEAELFQEVAKYTLYDTGVTVDYLEGFSCDREEAKRNILRLESCGLISRSEERLPIMHSDEMLGYKYVLQFNDYDLVVRGKAIANIKVFPFTSEGKELYGLIDKPKMSDDEAKTLLAHLYYSSYPNIPLKEHQWFELYKLCDQAKVERLDFFEFVKDKRPEHVVSLDLLNSLLSNLDTNP